ncbi:MAG: ATP synthase F1 subunit delta [Alphaproteobacteria bacterium]|nr:ATP synthase F1 subunit delta [Alphaproteobacteria bacterium]
MDEWGFVIENSVVNRYVKSIYDVAAKSKKEKEVGKQLTMVADSITGLSNFRKFLKKTAFFPQYGRFLVEFFKSNSNLLPEVSNLFDLLLENNRVNIIVDICRAYSAYLDKLDGKKLIYLTIANEPTKTQMNDLMKDLKDVFGSKIECITKVDPSLRDGFKLQHRSKVLDYSLKSKLKRLRNAIRSENYEN